MSLGFFPTSSGDWDRIHAAINCTVNSTIVEDAMHIGTGTSLYVLTVGLCPEAHNNGFKKGESFCDKLVTRRVFLTEFDLHWI